MKTSLIVSIEYNQREQMWQAEVFDDDQWDNPSLFYFMGTTYLEVVQQLNTFLNGLNNDN